LKSKEIEQPERVFYAVPGLKQAVILLDKDGQIAQLKKAAEDFSWEQLGDKPDVFAGRVLMDFAEEVYKILGGLERQDWSAVAAGSLAMTLSLPCAVAVYKRLLISTENNFFRDVIESVGAESKWSQYLKHTAGFEKSSREGTTIFDRGITGLSLYIETNSILNPILRDEYKDVIEYAIDAITQSKIQNLKSKI